MSKLTATISSITPAKSNSGPNDLGLTPAQVAASLGVKQGSVYGALAILEGLGLAQQVGRRIPESGKGNPVTLWKFNANLDAIAGVVGKLKKAGEKFAAANEQLLEVPVKKPEPKLHKGKKQAKDGGQVAKLQAIIKGLQEEMTGVAQQMEGILAFKQQLGG